MIKYPIRKIKYRDNTSNNKNLPPQGMLRSCMLYLFNKWNLLDNITEVEIIPNILNILTHIKLLKCSKKLGTCCIAIPSLIPIIILFKIVLFLFVVFFIYIY